MLLVRRQWQGWLALCLSLVLVACGGHKSSSDAATATSTTPTGTISLFAGATGLFGTLDGTAVSSSRFSEPTAVAADSNGNVYVLDTGNSTLRMIDSSGKVTTLAGVAGNPGSSDGQGGNARFNLPQGLAIDSGSSTASSVLLYVADTGNDTVRKVSVALSGGSGTATVSTLAGAAGVASFADGTGSAARFDEPFGVVVDASHQVYVADTGNNMIRKLDPVSGQVGLYAGSLLQTTVIKTTDTSTTPSTVNSSTATAMVASNTTPVAGSVSNPVGNVTTLTTTSYSVAAGFVDGAKGVGLLQQPQGMVFVGSTLYVADTGNNAIRTVDTAGNLGTLAGGGAAKDGIAGTFNSADGSPRFNGPTGLTADASGNIYVADTGNDLIRMVSSGGTVTTYAGMLSPYVAEYFYTLTTQAYTQAISGGTLVLPDNTKVAQGAAVVSKGSSFSPISLPAVDGLETLDSSNNATFTRTSVTAFADPKTIDTANPSAVVYDVVTTVENRQRLAGQADDTLLPSPPASTATTTSLAAVGTLMTTLYSQPKLLPSTSVEAFSGTSVVFTSSRFTAPAPRPGSSDGPAQGTISAVAQFHSPVGLCMLPNGVLYVADADSQTIRQISASQLVSTIAGAPGQPGYADGIGAQALLNNPAGLAFYQDPTTATVSYAFVADSGNNTVRVVKRTLGSNGSVTSSVVSTIAGQPGIQGWQDGTGSAALFHTPIGIALDSSGSSPVLYVSDADNNVIRKLVPSDPSHLDAAWTVSSFAGNTSTLGGSSSQPTVGLIDGPANVAAFNYPNGLAVYQGAVYVADTLNHAIRRIAIDNNSNSPTFGQLLVLTIAGNYNSVTLTGSAGNNVGGNALAARFNQPMGIAIDSLGNIYITEAVNHTVRKLQRNSGILFAYALAGTAGTPGHTDGEGVAASFNNPRGMVLVNDADPAKGARYLYVADAGNNTIRKIDLTDTTTKNNVSTVVGVAGKVGFQPGATPGYINLPSGIALDTTNAATAGLDLYISMGNAVVKVQGLP